MSISNSKYLKNIITIIILAIMALVIGCTYSTSGQIDKFKRKYHMYTIESSQFENSEYFNRIEDLILEDGIMTAKSNLTFMVIGDRNILDEPIKTISLNVDYLSCQEKQAKMYVLDSYQRFDFILKEGRCDIILPEKAELNEGNVPVLLRIDLLDNAGEKVKVDSVVFNDPDVYSKLILNENIDDSGKIFAVFAVMLIALYFFLMGYSKVKPNIAEIIAVAVITAVFILFKNIPLSFPVLIVRCFAGVRLIWIVYYFATSLIADKIVKSYRFFCVLAMIFALLLEAMLTSSAVWFMILASYPLYAFGYYYGLINPHEKHNWYKAAVVAAALMTIIFAAANVKNYTFGAVDTSAGRAYLLLCAIIAYVFVVFVSAFINDIKKYISNTTEITAAEISFPYALAYALAISLNMNISELNAFVCLIVSFAVGFILRHKNYKRDNIKYIGVSVPVLSRLFGFVILQIILAAALFGYESMVKGMLLGYGLREIAKHLENFVFTPVFVYNMVLANAFYFVYAGVFGRGLGRLLCGITGFLLFLANFVKLKYHNALFKPGDILQIRDFLSIVKLSVRFRHIIFFGIIIAAAVFLIVKFKKYLKPKFRPIITIVSVIFLAAVCGYISDNKLADIGITTVDKWLDDEIRTERQGFYIYSLYNALTIKDIIPQVPAGYSQNAIVAARNEFKQLDSKSDTDETKPDVIMLMMESVFDIEAVPQLYFNTEIEENIKKYKTTDLISPRYGGGTANVEFEALTGFSTYFFADSVVPYITYWNSDSSVIPSIAGQFKANGYDTVAIHPNDENFYNRRIVYNAMGFDDFISIEDMPSNILRNRRNYVYNEETIKYMIGELENHDAPLFMFALNIENHNPYDTKEANPTVELTGNSIELSDNVKNQTEVYSETLKNDDKMIGDVIEYMNNTDRPTLLYVWGDHLPALDVLNVTGFIGDPQNKYKTPVIMYSNYKDISAQGLITPNQLAAQAVRDAGIKYDDYFDFIYSLRNDNAVIHKEFNTDINDPQIKIYQMLQYDLLFGKKYYKEE